MKTQDKISKASFMFLESIRNVLSQNVSSAINTEALKIDPNDVARLMSILTQGIDSGYHQAHKTFMKMVDDAIKQHEVEMVNAKKKK